MRKTLALLAALVAAVAIGVVPASAVTDGQLDGNGHPYVGLMVAQDAKGNPLWRCSGTLIAPKLFLTAGHCTEAPAAHAEIWFASDVDAGRPGNGYPFNGDVEVREGTGDQLEVRGEKRGRRTKWDRVFFETKRDGDNVTVCAVYGDEAECDDDGIRGHMNSSGASTRFVVTLRAS